jgi:hypothetical protein
VPTFSYPVNLDGGLAARHEADPKELSKVQVLIADFLQGPLKWLDIVRAILVTPTVRIVAPYAATSFGINLRLSLEPKGQPQLFGDENQHQYNRFLNSYVSYCINDLPNRVIEVAHSPSGDVKLKELQEQYKEILGNRAQASQELESALRRSFVHAAQELSSISDTIGTNYTQLALMNVSNSGDQHVLGVLTESSKVSIDAAQYAIEESFGLTVKEQSSQSYEIYIYDLNTDSRIGRAIIKERSSGKKVLKPKIRISGDEPLARTKYTRSLDQEEFIEVKGRAKTVGDAIREINIEFEGETNPT